MPDEILLLWGRRSHPSKNIYFLYLYVRRHTQKTAEGTIKRYFEVVLKRRPYDHFQFEPKLPRFLLLISNQPVCVCGGFRGGENITGYNYDEVSGICQTKADQADGITVLELQWSSTIFIVDILLMNLLSGCCGLKKYKFHSSCEVESFVETYLRNKGCV